MCSFYLAFTLYCKCYDRSRVTGSRLSDSGEDAKVKGTRKVNGGGKKEKGKRKKEEISCSLFLNSPDYPGAWNRLGLGQTNTCQRDERHVEVLMYCNRKDS